MDEIKHVVDAAGRNRYFRLINEKWTRIKQSDAFEYISSLSEEKHHQDNNTNSNIPESFDYILLLAKNVGKSAVLPSMYHIFVDLVFYFNISMDNLCEILCGAYVIIENDHGLFYERWKQYQEKTMQFYSKQAKLTRSKSSHKSVVSQYRINGGKLYTPDGTRTSTDFDFLIGRSDWLGDQKQQYAHTTFQFERTNLESTGNMMKHVMIDYMYHWLHSKLTNVGPFGTSKYTEKQSPLVLKACHVEFDECQIIPCHKKLYETISKFF